MSCLKLFKKNKVLHRALKVWNFDGSRRVGIVAESLEDLRIKCSNKFKVVKYLYLETNYRPVTQWVKVPGEKS